MTGCRETLAIIPTRDGVCGLLVHVLHRHPLHAHRVQRYPCQGVRLQEHGIKIGMRCNNERDASNAREPVEPVRCRLVRYEGANAE